MPAVQCEVSVCMSVSPVVGMNLMIRILVNVTSLSCGVTRSIGALSIATTEGSFLSFEDGGFEEFDNDVVFDAMLSGMEATF